MDESNAPHSALAALAKRAPTLELGTLDLCFVAALYLRSRGELLTSFGTHELGSAFDDACAALGTAGDAAHRRVTHAIQRLREQRLLARVDGAGVVRSGEYALTRLALGIVEFFLRDEALTKESLSLLTRSLLVNLQGVRDAARSADRERFRSDVAGPLAVTVADLVSGIERRQRGLDLQQEQLQREIATLLQADWFAALAQCQALLEETSRTLRELNEILLRDAHELLLVLQEIQDLAARAGADDAERAAQSVAEQVDRIAAWGSSRQRAWSDYYQHVHHFLRDVVRLDPTRALSERLREQLGGRRGPRFALCVAQAPALAVPRETRPVLEPPPLRRPRREREIPLEERAPNAVEDALETRVRALLGRGVADLSALTAELLPELPAQTRYAAAGRIAGIVARLARPLSARERPWIASGEDLELEEWRVASAGRNP